MANAVETDEMTFEDEEVEVPVSTEYPTIPAGVYDARLIGFKREAKPDWKLKGDEDENGKQQFKWTFEITAGEYAGNTLSDWTNVSWHEKATAHKYGAALLGVPTLPVGVGVSTGQFAGKTCQIWVSEVPTKKDANVFRNYIDKVTPTPTPRMRPGPRSQAPQGTPAVKRTQLDNFPSDLPPEAEGGDWDDIQPE